MDIKDFILIGGGLLIVAVVAHGFWLAYRAKREPYRLDIVHDLVPDDVDDIERLRGELPNGGSRIKSSSLKGANGPSNLELELEVPFEESLDTAPEPTVNTPIRAQAHTEQIVDSLEPPKVEPPKVEPRNIEPPTTEAPSKVEPQFGGRARPTEQQMDILEDTPPKARVADIQIVTTNKANKKTSRDRVANKARIRAREPEQSTEQEIVTEELLVVGVLAPKGTRFEGDALVNALRKQGLKYGEMNIFHRVDPSTKAKNFSVANLVEPGTFDLSDLEKLASPGITFFLQLPGPEDALSALEDMLHTAQQIAVDLGGELRDEQMSALTGQIREHMRQRIADFARRKLSKRA